MDGEYVAGATLVELPGAARIRLRGLDRAGNSDRDDCVCERLAGPGPCNRSAKRSGRGSRGRGGLRVQVARGGRHIACRVDRAHGVGVCRRGGEAGGEVLAFGDGCDQSAVPVDAVAADSQVVGARRPVERELGRARRSRLRCRRRRRRGGVGTRREARSTACPRRRRSSR